MEVGVAISSPNVDYGNAEPRMAVRIAGNRMSVAAMARLLASNDRSQSTNLGR